VTSFLEKGKRVEQSFAKDWLLNPIFATKEEDMGEHWDVKGILDWIEDGVLKFDVKGMKKINRQDSQAQSMYTWVEGKNVLGKDGWIKGGADYIVFERLDQWIVAKRTELLALVQKKCKDKEFKEGKGVYEIYQRQNRLDKLTLVPFTHIIALENTWCLPKYS